LKVNSATCWFLLRKGNCHLAQSIQFYSSTAFFLSAALLRHCFIGDQQIVQVRNLCQMEHLNPER